jgi:hypothetical protein
MKLGEEIIELIKRKRKEQNNTHDDEYINPYFVQDLMELICTYYRCPLDTDEVDDFIMELFEC